MLCFNLITKDTFCKHISIQNITIKVSTLESLKSNEQNISFKCFGLKYCLPRGSVVEPAPLEPTPPRGSEKPRVPVATETSPERHPTSSELVGQWAIIRSVRVLVSHGLERRFASGVD